MDERRQFVRLDTRLPVTYRILPERRRSPQDDQAAQTPQPQRSDPRASVTKDLSGGGICLFVTEELPLGTLLGVELQLPDQAQAISFTGEIAWCEKYSTIGKTRRDESIEAGVRVVQTRQEDQQAIMRYVILALRPHPIT